MEDVGFIIVKDIAGYDEEKLQQATEWFFDQPLEWRMRVTRKKWNANSKNLYRGYFPVDHTAISYKEGFEIGQEIPEDDPEIKSGYPLVENTPWPVAPPGEDQLPYQFFSETMKIHFNFFFDASVELMRLIAIGLDLQENFFDHLFIPKTLSTLRLLSYPPRTKAPPPDAVTEDGTVLYCDSHADVGILTMLTSFGQPGLQVLLNDGSWLDVKSSPGGLIVNLGEMLAEMSGHRIKATQHRVVDTGGRRLSVPFFLEPGYHGKLPLSLPTSIGGKEGKYNPEEFFKYGPCLWERLKRRAEYGADITKTDN